MKYSKFNVTSFLRMPKNTFFCLLLIVSCKNNGQKIQSAVILPESHNPKKEIEVTKGIVLAANRTGEFLPILEGKRVGVVTNQTGIVKRKNTDYIHLIDTLQLHNVNVTKVFAPEHGFRGEADAGEVIKDGKDIRSGLPIVSLYGKNKKPSPEQLSDVDIVLFDLQDVGVRFYTYISTLHYVMEACAELGLPLLLLDRPNPNGHYIDGAVLEAGFESFVGMHPVPVVYGMTIGEYAMMINGEKWLAQSLQADLTVIPLENYTHQTPYSLPVRPSPNLPNDVAVNLYPSLCFFEGANMSMGRGTDLQFQIYGSPYMENNGFSFVPEPNFGDKNPKFKGQLCYGENLTAVPRLSEINLSWLIQAYEQSKSVKTPFFNNFFDKLAGNDQLRQQIIRQETQENIRASWQPELEKFKRIRDNYLIYK